MLKNWSDSEVLKKLKLQSDTELQPDSVMKFLGSEKAAALTGVTTVAGAGLIMEGTAGTAGTAAVVGGVAALSITAGLAVIAAGYFAYKSNWDYETRIEMLKQKMTKDFDNSLKYMIVHKFTTIYDKMVVDCEKHNKFVE